MKKGFIIKKSRYEQNKDFYLKLIPGLSEIFKRYGYDKMQYYEYDENFLQEIGGELKKTGPYYDDNENVFQTFREMIEIFSIVSSGDNVYHVCDNMSKALMETKVNTRLSNVKLPFYNFCINFPGQKINNNGDDVTFNTVLINSIGLTEDELNVMKERNGLLFKGLSKLLYKGNDMMRNGISMSFLNIEGKMMKLAIPFEDIVDLNDLPTFSRSESPETVLTQKRLIGFILNVISYVTSQKPELVAHDPNPKKAGKKKNRSQQPCILVGPSFKNIYSGINQSTGSASWRLDSKVYVSGHWREQPYGPKNNVLYKTIWIEPYSKGPDLAESLGRNYIVTED